MLPHFLCIGAQKAGTTWLYHNLDSHPEVWMPPLKELFYFCGFAASADGLPAPASRWPLLAQAALPRNAPLRVLLRDAARKARGGGAAPAVADPAPAAAAAAPPPAAPPPTGKLQKALWLARYALLPRTDRWYASLFRPGPGQIAGDITPYYANLPPARVQQVHALLPGARIVYLLRNPVERLWSEAGMAARRRSIDLPRAEAESLRAFFRERHAARLAAYVDNTETWRRCYGADAVHVGFFDDLQDDPTGLLRGIYAFLGVDSSAERVPPDVAEKRFAGKPVPIPAEWAEFLADLFRDDVARMRHYFEHPCTERWWQWIEEHKSHA